MDQERCEQQEHFEWLMAKNPIMTENPRNSSSSLPSAAAGYENLFYSFPETTASRQYLNNQYHASRQYLSNPYETSRQYLSNPYETSHQYLSNPYETSRQYLSNPYQASRQYLTNPYDHATATNIHMNPSYHANNSCLYDNYFPEEFDQLNLSATPHHQSVGEPLGRVGAEEFNQLNLSAIPHHQSVGGSVGRVGSVAGNKTDQSFLGSSNSYIDHYQGNSVGNAQFPISYPTTQQYMNGGGGGAYQKIRLALDSAGKGIYMAPPPQYVTQVDDHHQVFNSNVNGLTLDNQIAPQQIFLDDVGRRPGYILPNGNNGNVFLPSGRNKIKNFQRNERSLDGFDYNYPSTLSSSFYNKCRQRGQNLSSLEELRSKIFSSLEELRGKIFIVAKDQNGARDLQKILAEGKPEEKEIIFSELKNHVRELMMDQFANYLAQKMFEVGDAEQITELLLLIINDERSLVTVCHDMHGTRAMQKLLGHLTTPPQRSLIISALRRITVILTKSTNGHHVIEHCLKHFPNEDKKYILDVVADNCLDIAMDKSGCCVLQQCVEHARGEPRDSLIAEITANALVLAENPFGNYVVQFIIGLRIPHITSDILAQLYGNFVSLSMNKYGSNVVEKCMKESSEEQAMQIIKEIIGSPNFLTVLQDPFGNYVAQSAFAIAKGSIRHAMINLIQMHYSYLHSHPHGKRVLSSVRGSKQR
ncbi:hypothetical protein ACH5RR_002194 [Cinchona calisaya]|uniref:PUM-HD domain-containing protein n=1 Tax=Cinchona calisaya TaxID=153742 RepID=A0ABD3B678_9GENT